MSVHAELAASGAVLVPALVGGLGSGTIVPPLDVGDGEPSSTRPSGTTDHDGGHG